MKVITPAIAALALAWTGAVHAQSAPTVGAYQVPSGSSQIPAQGVQIIGYDSVTGALCVIGQTATCSLQSSGGGGGGGGAVTAASGAFALGSIVDLGTGASPGANTVNGYLKTIDTTLGSPFQAGGSIGNTAFGISGTLPAFASTPTVNAAQSGTWNVGLSTGSNAIGSITNTGFGITGTLPAFASTPTVNAAQSGTWNVGLSTGSNAIGSITNTSFASTQSGAWNTGGLTGVNQTGSITRIANTTVYAANELICLYASSTACAPIQVTIAGANAATGTLGRVMLGKTGTSLTGATFTIWFFSAAPTTTSMYDHTAYVGPFAADLPNYLGSYTCNAMQATNDGTAQAFSECTPTAGQGWMQYQTLSGQKYVDALITVTGAYTPISGEVFTIYANSLQDK
jgi:hypothetical protein